MSFFKIILVLHIIAGSIGLVLGTFVLVRKKGDKTHKLLGKIFTASMLITGILALVLSYIHTNMFLFIVGVFTIYLTATGYRIMYLKNILNEQKPKSIDYILTLFMLISSITFLYLGILNLIKNNYFGIVLCLFGTISLRLCYIDYKIYSKKVIDNLFWLKNHIGRMTGAYIAAFTAFLVVNNTFINPILAWSLPGIIGTLFIFRTIKNINKKIKL